MIEQKRREPSDLLAEQIENVLENAQRVLSKHIEIEETSKDDHYANALDHLSAMQRQSGFALIDDYSSSALYDAFRDFLKDIAKEQEYYSKLEYRDDRYNDSVLNLLRWFKLHSGARLDNPPKIHYEFIIENFDEFRIDLAHGHSAQPSSADPVLQSMLVLLWRVVEDILDVWELLLSQSEFESLASDVNLPASEGDVGFICDIGSKNGEVTTYQQGESGTRAEFDLKDTEVLFFPTGGDLVRIEFADDPEDYRYHREKVPISKLAPL